MAYILKKKNDNPDYEWVLWFEELGQEHSELVGKVLEEHFGVPQDVEWAVEELILRRGHQPLIYREPGFRPGGS